MSAPTTRRLTTGQQSVALARVSAFCGIDQGRLLDAMSRAGVMFADDESARVLPFGRVTDTLPCDVEAQS